MAKTTEEVQEAAEVALELEIRTDRVEDHDFQIKTSKKEEMIFSKLRELEMLFRRTKQEAVAENLRYVIIEIINLVCFFTI